MAAPLGNKFWEARSKHGRKTLWENKEELEEACLEYFTWCDNNPLYEIKPMQASGDIQDVPIPRMRAFTIEGMCVFLGIHRSTWNDYRTKDDFSEVVGWADEVMRNQKLQGAAAGFLNANIIARDLGLKDASEVSGPSGGPVQIQEIIFKPVGNDER